MSPFLIYFSLSLLAIDLYTFKGIRLLTRSWKGRWYRKAVQILFWAVTAAVIGTVAIMSFTFTQDYLNPDHQAPYAAFALVITVYIPKVFFIAFHLLDDILHGIRWIISRFSAPAPAPSNSLDIVQSGPKMSRLKFISRVGIGVAALSMGAFANALINGRFNYRVINQTLTFSNLPKAFDGLRIVQISDLHLGSFFKNYGGVQKGLDMIMDLKPDMILFTGDLVNDYAAEAESWIPLFKNLEAPMGKYSVLGNHDYGEYAQWEGGKGGPAWEANLKRVKEINGEMGFRLLLNENLDIEKGGQKFSLLGIENWGGGGFSKYGKLDKAMVGSDDNGFQLLMSHDPSHWDLQVLEKTKIDLALAGHTHGMQFGVELGDFKFSPVQWRYPRWAGLYQEKDQYLYVNRGFGYIGFPGRVGIAPEITLLELKSGMA